MGFIVDSQLNPMVLNGFQQISVDFNKLQIEILNGFGFQWIQTLDD